MNNIENVIKIKIEPTLCNNCENCNLACPWSIFQFKENKTVPYLVNPELCVSCGHCLAVCSTGAITHSDFKKGNINSVNFKNIPSYNQILELFRSRRSVRAFIDKPVEKEIIERIINASCFAPSTNNIQSTEYTVVQNKDIIKKIKDLTVNYLIKNIRFYQNPLIINIYKIKSPEKAIIMKNIVRDYKAVLKSIKKQNDLILHNATVLLFFYADRNIGFTDVNASLALQNATLAVHSLGLGSFYAGYVTVACKNNREIKKILKIPKKHQIFGCLAIGHPKLKYDNWIDKKSPKIEWI